MIVPPGRLHAIPWALLPVLGDRVFSVAPSAGAWMRAHTAPPPRRRHVTLARGPGLVTDGAEVPLVASLYDDVTVLSGGDATAARVLSALDGAWLAHIAAHGTFRADSPLFSSLRMHDGPLTVYDFEQLRRAPYRLVLSSCDSGVLAPVGADELLGLVSSLLPLGTAGIIASVVPLNDYAAVPLMVGLHRHLRAGQSLAEAMCSVRQELTGDPIQRARRRPCWRWAQADARSTSVIHPVTASMPAAVRQRSRNGAGGMGRTEKQPISSAGNAVSAPSRGWTLIVAAWAGTTWPSSESWVTSSSMVRCAEVKVSARTEAASARTLSHLGCSRVGVVGQLRELGVDVVPRERVLGGLDEFRRDACRARTACRSAARKSRRPSCQSHAHPSAPCSSMSPAWLPRTASEVRRPAQPVQAAGPRRADAAHRDAERRADLRVGGAGR